MKTAIVTGCPGQVATHLVNHLLGLNYKVVGTYRYSSQSLQDRFKNYPLDDPNFLPVCVDIVDPSAVSTLVRTYQPDEIYNLAAAAHVGESFKNPSSVFDINTKAVINFLEALRDNPATRFIQASTSEMWGSNYTIGEDGARFQDEQTPFNGNSPYAVAKIAAHNMVELYQRSYDLYCCSYIAHNHEGEYRGENYVTMKIIKWLVSFKSWLKTRHDKLTFSKDHIHCAGDAFPKLRLGNINAVRDWSYAGDFAEAAHLILQQDEPKTYVLASGRGRSVKDFLDAAFATAKITMLDITNFYVIDPAFYRPCEVEFLQGRSDLIRDELGWEPKTSFEELVERMYKFANANFSR